MHREGDMELLLETLRMEVQHLRSVRTPCHAITVRIAKIELNCDASRYIQHTGGYLETRTNVVL